MKIQATAQSISAPSRDGKTDVRSGMRPPTPRPKPKTVQQRIDELLAGGVKPALISNMLHSMGLLLRAGIPVGRCVEICAQQEVHPRLREVLTEVYGTVATTGAQLSTAFARYPTIFSQELILLMRAGEVSGELAARLDQAAILLDRQIKLSNKIKEAVTSPLVTAGICLVMTYGVVRFVLPRFLGLYDGMHVQLPLFSQVVIGLVKLINDPIVTAAGLGGVAMIYVNRDRLSQSLMTWGLNFPLTRGFIGQLLATSFCDVVGHLYADGVAISTALEMMSQTTKITSYRRILQRVTAQFKTDGQLSEAVKMVPFFPATVVRMLKVGEESGQIDKMLFCLGSILDESNQELFQRVVTALEPIMMATVGAVLCFFFVGLFLPIYGLLSHLGM